VGPAVALHQASLARTAHAEHRHEADVSLEELRQRTQIRAAAQAYKAYFRIQPAEDEFYLVDHSTFTYLVLPGIGFVEFFRRETTPDEMADRVACFIGRM